MLTRLIENTQNKRFFVSKTTIYRTKGGDVMAKAISKETLKEATEFAKQFEKLSDRDKGYMLGYMDCLNNGDNEKKKKVKT